MDLMNNSTGCFNINKQEEYILSTLLLCGGSVSFMFCLMIYFVAILFQKYTQTTQRLILYLTISVNLSAIVNILHGARPHPLTNDGSYCIAAGFFDQVTSWMVLLGVCCLTFDLFLKVIFLVFDTSRLEPIYCITIFIIPFTFNWIPFINHAYGPSGATCWIKLTKSNDCTKIDYYYLILRLVLFWIPFALILLIVVVAYFIILIVARRRLRAYSGQYNPMENTTRQLLYREVRWYLLYPILLFVTFTGTLLSRIYELIDIDGSGNLAFSLRVIHILSVTLQGIVIAAVFALDYDTRRQITQFHSMKAALYNLFCCCNKREVTDYETAPVSGSDSLKSQYIISNDKSETDTNTLSDSEH